MASFTIPEEIIGIPLFVPSAYNFFEIETGGMPNGDDCLIVRGDLSTTYRAFQAAPLGLTPDIFANSTPTSNWSMTIWFKGSTVVGASFNGAILTVQNQSGITPNGNTDINTALYFRWYGTSGIAATRNVRTGISPSSAGNCLIYNNTKAALTDGNWHLLTLIYTSDGNLAIYFDKEATSFSSDGANNGASIDFSQQYLSLGNYSGVSPGGRAGLYRIGKLGFHSGALNLTQRSILYNTMYGL